MSVSRMVITVMFSSMLSLCTEPNPVIATDSGIDPFANDGNVRSEIVIISDLHLGADSSYSEFIANRTTLEKFLDRVGASSNVKELVIGGDLLDEWFVPATTNTYGGKDQSDFVKRIAITNKGVIDAFNRIIQAGKITVTYVPGNHDLTITSANVESILPGIRQARDAEQGLGTYLPAGHTKIAIEHSHRYNFFCAPDPISNKDIAPGSILPPGYFFTRIATLHVVQHCTIAGDTIMNITPNKSGDASQNLEYAYWKIWKGLITGLPIQNRFKDTIIVTNINGFTGTYAVNDLLPYQLIDSGSIDVNLYGGIIDSWDQRQTLNHVAVKTPAMEALLGAASNAKTDSQAIVQYFMNPSSNMRIVVFGHTHEAKIVASLNLNGLKSIYANSGTWIDRNPGKTTMDFLVITPQATTGSGQTYVNLYNYQDGAVARLVIDSTQI